MTDEMLLEDDGEGAAAPWQVMIVDDEGALRQVTRLVMADFSFADRAARFSGYHSAALRAPRWRCARTSRRSCSMSSWKPSTPAWSGCAISAPNWETASCWAAASRPRRRLRVRASAREHDIDQKQDDEQDGAALFDAGARRVLAQAAQRPISAATARLDDGAEGIRTLAVWGDDYLPNLEYALRHTPCQDVSAGRRPRA